tara:strand:- start:753 stop:1292 length:540 start_codon:yes stop_codon:yes gene_type:complete
MNLNKALITGILLALPTLAIAKPPPTEGKRAENRALLEKVREKHPEKFAHLMRLRDEDPKAFRHAMRRVRARMGMDMDAHDPRMREKEDQMLEMREEIREALQTYRAAEGREKDKARADIDELANEFFDLRQAHRRLRLERIRNHVSELESEIRERDENREAFIEEWIDKRLESKPRGL